MLSGEGSRFSKFLSYYCGQRKIIFNGERERRKDENWMFSSSFILPFTFYLMMNECRVIEYHVVADFKRPRAFG